MPPVPPTAAGSHWGAIIGIVLIVLLLAAGGAYFFYMQLQSQEQQRLEAMDQAMMEQNTPAPPSTNEDSIESDLNTTQTTGADADLDSLEQAL